MAHTDVGVRGSGQVGGRATGGAFGPPPHMHVRRPRGPPHSVDAAAVCAFCCDGAAWGAAAPGVNCAALPSTAGAAAVHRDCKPCCRTLTSKAAWNSLKQHTWEGCAPPEGTAASVAAGAGVFCVLMKCTGTRGCHTTGVGRLITPMLP
eukprot:1158144-Pelagomonas_calceolata.AAC.8